MEVEEAGANHKFQPSGFSTDCRHDCSSILFYFIYFRLFCLFSRLFLGNQAAAQATADLFQLLLICVTRDFYTIL